MSCPWKNGCPLRTWENAGIINDRWLKHYCETDSVWLRCRRYRMESRGIPHENILPDGSIMKR